MIGREGAYVRNKILLYIWISGVASALLEMEHRAAEQFFTLSTRASPCISDRNASSIFKDETLHHLDFLGSQA